MLVSVLKSSLADVSRDIRHATQIKRLPKRVRETIAEKENAGEILVKLIQLGIVFTLGTLYFLTPKSNTHLAFHPVPYFLLAYLILNVIGLVWAALRPLKDWSIYGSILIDFTLLYGLIWSFHIQYQQPPSFMLKMPTLLYVFIFIALRTLRFRSRFVLAAGLVATLGWAGLVIYAIDPEHDMVTRDFITYMTSNSILLGAEFDKIVSILIVTFVLVIALRRANSFFVSAITETNAAQQFSRFFDKTVAAGIRDAQDSIMAGDGVRRTGAILTVDIRGFSKLAQQLDPSDVVAMLAAYQQAVLPIIRKHGGSIDKFMGDGIMASFGAVADSDRFAVDAIRAAEEIADHFATITTASDELNLVVEQGIGLAVAAGPVVFGAIGVEDRLEVTVIGAPVNLSAKLEKFNKDLGSTLIVGQRALAFARAQGYEPSAPPRLVSSDVPGVDKPVELAVLR